MSRLSHDFGRAMERVMIRRRRLVHAVVAALAAPGAAQAALDETVVTATKREQPLQQVAVAVQALDAAALDALGATRFEDYVHHVPVLHSAGRGPGQATLFLRGMAVEPITVLLSAAQGSAPNVALLVDDQPVTAPGRNLDVYPVDLERIEIMPGPQGTLFGASAQAGTVRLVTRRPSFDGFEAGGDVMLADTRGGDASAGVEAFLNVPLNDRVALRGAFYNTRHGGWIDNVAGTFTTDPAVNPASNATPDAVRYQAATNAALVDDDFNARFQHGARLGARVDIAPDWALLVQHTRQALGADGVFDYDPEVGDLEVERYFPDRLRDDFDLTTLRVEGRLRGLDLIYSAGLLDRDIDQSVDYTGYNNVGGQISYYTCTYDDPRLADEFGFDPAVITPAGRECLDPVKGVRIRQDHRRWTHELRVHTPADRRTRLMLGAQYDHLRIDSMDDFIYPAIPDLGFAPNAPIPGAAANDASTRPPEVAFFNDVTRTERQLAAFGEIGFDVIPALFEVALGFRYYGLAQGFRGQSAFASGIFAGSVDRGAGRNYDNAGSIDDPSFDPDAPPAPGGVDPDVPGHSTAPLKQSGWIPRLMLSLTPTAHTRYSLSYSEGFRPGGFNRGGGVFSLNPGFPTVPTTYETDDVKSYELGWKTQWLDQRLRFNGSAWYIDWTDMQIPRFDPENISILTFIDNAARSEIWGLEADAAWAVNARLTLHAALAWQDASLVEISSAFVDLPEAGARLPLVPEFQGSARARYDWSAGGHDLFVQGGLVHAGASYSALALDERERQGSWTTLHAAAGIARDAWRLQVFADNLTDRRPQRFINRQDNTRRIATERPRTVGVRVSMRF